MIPFPRPPCQEDHRIDSEKAFSGYDRCTQSSRWICFVRGGVNRCIQIPKKTFPCFTPVCSGASLPAGTHISQRSITFLFSNRLPGNRAHLIVVERTATGSVNTHNQTASRIGADHAGICLHPIGRVVEPLLGRQQRKDRLQSIQTKVGSVRQGKFAAVQIKAIPYAHRAGTVPFNFFNDHPQVV